MENRKAQKEQDGEDETMNDSPIEQVRLIVPATDDPTLPTLTFRTWVLGPITCAVLAFMAQFYQYRQNVISIPTSCVQMALVALGKLMAATLPSKSIKVPGTIWSFSTNPGPFNIKENVLLTILATSGADRPFSIITVVVRKVFYHNNLSFGVSFLMVLTIQFLGYGFAGIYMKYLVDNPYMWYPYTLLDVSFYSALHQEEARPKRGLTKLQLVATATVASFAYAIIPGYFFPSISSLSVLCWFWKRSVVAQQIGSARHGLAIGAFAFDWAAISGYCGNPLILPFSTIINTTFGFILLLYIVCPIAYLTNAYNARHFPFFDLNIFDKNGQIYNVSRIVNQSDLTFNQKSYENYSNIYKTTVNVFLTGFGFATVTASLTHFVTFHGREFWQQLKQVNAGSENTAAREDVHNRLMKKYDRVPQWWFLAILVSSIGLGIFSCEGFGKQLQLPYWGVLLACILVSVSILPVSVIAATTGQSVSFLSTFSDLIIGYIYPGKPTAYQVFTDFCESTEYHALTFIQDFKLAHYMKIAPISMFVAQVTGTFISAFVSLITSWWLISTVDNICDPKRLPEGSPWTCPGILTIYNRSVTWGVVGPKRMYFPDGVYSRLFYFFFIGLMGPIFVWMLSKYFPQKKWIKGINIPVLLASGGQLAQAGAVNYWSFISVGFFFNLFVYRKYKDWWSKYNYVTAYGLDLGIAFQALLATLTLQMSGVFGVDWWGLDVNDHCPLALCPTAPGVSVEGCPIVA